MKATIKKTLFISLTVLCIVLMFASLTACNTMSLEELVSDYGQENAYDTANNGELLHLKSGSIVSFYIPESIQGDYRKCAEYTVERANNLTSSITVNITTDPNSKFQFSVVEFDPINPEANAMNHRMYIPETGQIVKSTIRFSSSFLDSKSLEYKMHTALHEMLHTFGIGHVEASKMKGKSLMTDTHPEQKSYQMTEYSDFDRANIIWKYGK